ncbi:P-protein PheA [Gottschalkia purinilytica]|uniref:Bifunctional chorismate mutase/prephenate dehydratase n=1 Tax=Gottschalkia purinilytica TaxID=1503 RepID=A0A0L0WEY5_GOTPU|nr:prephenate dehydratase [Gottschalkia purinilytica]KNF09991.1 P-protein PheA [Gottschalkia purinilytica]
MNELDDIRTRIDCIDKEITKLFEERMSKVIQVAQYKEKNNQPIFDNSREEEVIRRNKTYLKDKEYEKALEEFYKELMAISRRIQAKKIFCEHEYDNKSSSVYNIFNSIKEKKENIKVCFQGVPGAFSEQALIEYFGENTPRCNVAEFEDVFKQLKNEDVDYGILPIENSSTGGISEVCDLLRKYGFYIVGERSVKVDHNLLGIKGSKLEDIKEIYSHPQALQQSSEFLKTSSSWRLFPYRNTAESAKLVKESNRIERAAIASRKAAELYDLEIIASSINYNNNNHTRFIIIGKNLEIDEESNKVSVVMSVPHKPGALYSALNYFAENNLNMQRIESRPIIDKSWEYFFYIDFEGNLKDENLRKAIADLEKNSLYFKLLGNYKSHV